MIKLLQHNPAIRKQLNKKGSTLFEVMMMLVILSMVLLTFFEVLSHGIRFARDTEMRIQAVNLAREGIEGVTNIRNTNWLRYSSDRKNCWNTKNYNSSCIGTAGFSDTISWSYILHSENGLWKLESTWAWEDSADWKTKFERYQLFVDNTGWYNGFWSWDTTYPPCTNKKTTDCVAPFARNIVITHTTATGMTVTSTVHWYNAWEREVSITSELTNWKSLYD